jgi:hypothetical protein
MTIAVKDKNVLRQIFEGLGSLSALIFPALKKESLSFSNLYEQVWAKSAEFPEWVWLIDLFIEESTKQTFALFSKEGLLYTAEIIVENSGISIGELIRVKEVFEPISNNLLIRQQNDGTKRWFLISCSSVLNRSAAIDSTKLFDNLIKRATESSKFPYLTYYHLGDPLKMGMTDWLARDGNLLLSSGTFEKDNPIADCMQEAYEKNPEIWGASISFWPFEGHMEPIMDGVSVPMYTDGEFEEISILKEQDANCLFTALHSNRKVNKMDQKLVDQLKVLFGDNEDLLGKVVAQVDESNKTITEQGLIARQAPVITQTAPDPVVPSTTAPVSTDPAVVEPTAEDPAVVDPPISSPEDENEVPIEIDEKIVDSIVEKLSKYPNISQAASAALKAEAAVKVIQDSLGQELAELRAANAKTQETVSARLSKLELDEEKKRDEWQKDMPKNSKVVVNYRPRGNSAVDDPSGVKSMQEIAEESAAKIK